MVGVRGVLAALAWFIVPVALGGQIGLWEYTFDGSIEDMVWVRDDKRTVLFRTDTGQVHLSTDEGKSFRSVQEDLGRLMSPIVARDTEIKAIVVTEHVPDFVLLVSRGTINYVSSNGGVSFSAFRSPSPIFDVQVHPTMPKHLLWSSKSPSCPASNEESVLKLSNQNELDDGKDSTGTSACYMSLYYSENQGGNAKLLKKYVVGFDWAIKLHKRSSEEQIGADLGKEGAAKRDKDEPPPKSIMGAHQAGKILVTSQKEEKGQQSLGRWDANVDLFISEPDRFDGTLLVKGGNKFLFLKSFLFVAQVQDQDHINLQLSGDMAKTFYSGTLPFQLTQRSYTMLDASEGVVFLHVNHGSEGPGSGHVYVSDSTGFNYSFSLRDNVRDSDGTCDFERVRGIEGVYVANYVQEAADPDQGSGIQKYRPRKKKVGTLISFDRGGEWSLLRAPVVDSTGKAIPCSSSQCSLHLHGHYGTTPPVYSSQKAIGLVLGVGNVGSTLSFKNGDLNTYFSRDGGLTWSEVRKGSHIYEFGDHGGLIAMAKDTAATNKLIYSWKQGLDWTEIAFSQKEMDVDNVISEPSATTRVFHVYGTRPSASGAAEGVIVTADFGSLGQRQCQGALQPRSAASDYEVWSPRDTASSPGGFGNGCHMGHVVEYTRRKQDSDCFNPNKFEPLRFMRVCECTERDYECDVGFVRNFGRHICVRDPRVDNVTARVVQPQVCPPSGQYEISNGYRLVGGNTCTGGKQLAPTVYSCKSGFLGISHSGWFVLLCIIGLLGTMTYTSYKPHADRAMDAFGTRTFDDSTGSCWDWVKDFVRSKESRSKFFDEMRRGRGAGNGFGGYSSAPDSMAFDDGDFGDDEEFGNIDHSNEFDYDDRDDDDGDDGQEAELISPTTSAHPLPQADDEGGSVAVPALNAPPTAQPLDLFGDEDDDTGDIV